MHSHHNTVLENLAEYLSFCYEQNYTRLGKTIPKEYQNIVKLLKDQGYCFGLSLIHAAMGEINKLDWWEYVLECLERWNKDKSLLNKKISEIPELAKFIPLTMRGKQRETLLHTPLGDLFERAVHYIVYQQAELLPFFPKNLDQITLLQPNSAESPLFWIVDENENILTIKDRQIPAAGYLSLENIEAVLKDVDQVMCLVHNSIDPHTIHVGVHGDKWFVYDPNYKRDDSKSSCSKYVHYFPNREAASKEILSILGPEIAIEMATTSTQKMKKQTLTLDTDEKLSQYIQINLSENAFFSIAQYTPDVLMQLMTLIVDQNNTSPQTNHLRELFARSLAIEDTNGWTVFRVIARYAPEALNNLVVYMTNDNSPESELVKKSFADTLLPNKNGLTGLHAMAQTAPQVLTTLIKHLYAAKNISHVDLIKTNLLKALTIKSKKGWLGLRAMAYYAPDALIYLLTHIDIHTEFKVRRNDGKLIKLTIAEQVIVYAYKTENSNLIQKVFSELKKDKMDIDDVGVKKILSIFDTSERKEVSYWIQEEFKDFKDQEKSHVKKRQLPEGLLFDRQKKQYKPTVNDKITDDSKKIYSKINKKT